MLKLVKVTGNSMSPTLEDGDYVITKKPRHYQAGLIYVVNHIDLGRIIKRLDGAPKNGCYIFKGDNTDSTPSSVIGSVEPSRIVGQVWFVIGKSGLKRL